MPTINGSNASETINHLDGVTSGADSIYGHGGSDTIYGLGGNDVIHGGSGADDIYGGSGSDTSSYIYSDEGVFVSLKHNAAAYGDAEGDELHNIENLEGSLYRDNLWGNDDVNVLKAYDGDDTLKGYGGADTLYGDYGNDMLYGGSGDDTIFGGAANTSHHTDNDIIDGGYGNDTMIGGYGDDTYYVDSAADIVTELAGQGTYDVVFANIASYTLADNVEILSLADSLVGINATGNSQSNTIFGNANDNTLNGGGSSDALSGLGGNDTFVFAAGQAQGDVVYEFDGNGAGAGDVIRFEGYGTLAEGATFHQLSATHWQVTSADGTIQETIVFDGAYSFDTTTDLIFI